MKKKILLLALSIFLIVSIVGVMVACGNGGTNANVDNGQTQTGDNGNVNTGTGDNGQTQTGDNGNTNTGTGDNGQTQTGDNGNTNTGAQTTSTKAMASAQKSCNCCLHRNQARGLPRKECYHPDKIHGKSKCAVTVS